MPMRPCRKATAFSSFPSRGSFASSASSFPAAFSPFQGSAPWAATPRHSIRLPSASSAQALSGTMLAAVPLQARRMGPGSQSQAYSSTSRPFSPWIRG